MKQVCLVAGRISVIDVPVPMCKPEGVLVRTSHSLISTGTELAATGGGGGESLIWKALTNPHLVAKVWEKAGTLGVNQTLNLVRGHLSSSLPLGYSAAGVVIEAGTKVNHIKVGDRVACAGSRVANHAEFDFVPQNLLSRIPGGVSYLDAAFGTVGAIAMQGVRRLNPSLGEQIVVVGLGLIGLIVIQLVRLSGARVFGVDVLQERVDLGRSFGLENGMCPGDREPAQRIQEWTEGNGADGVIVCASGVDFSLLNRSFDLCRRKGRVVLVGDVPIRIAREKIYTKEIDFFISCSYGPGRYDPRYEQMGMDYPLPYVRWTEGRNLSEVLRLMAQGLLRVSALVGQVFSVEDAAAAYSFLQSEHRPIAALLEYGLREKDLPPSSRYVRLHTAMPSGKGRVVLGVLGAGTFFRSVHLPNLLQHGGFTIKWACSRTGVHLRDTASRYQIPSITTDPREVLADPEVEAILIATRHGDHAELVAKAAGAGKHIFVEKPLGMSVAECEYALSSVEKAGVLLAVGFNRRFSPLAIKAKSLFEQVGEPKTLLYRVNAGRLPPDHWLNDPAQGGGRLMGEGVHFFDLMRFLLAADPVRVTAACTDRTSSGAGAENVAVNICFAEGSLGVLIYTSQGHRALGKERIEIFGGNATVVIDDFSSLRAWGFAGIKDERRRAAEKGHLEILQNFHDAIRGRAVPGVTGRDGYWATWCSEQADRAIRERA